MNTVLISRYIFHQVFRWGEQLGGWMWHHSHPGVDRVGRSTTHAHNETLLLRAHGHKVFISEMFILLQMFCQYGDGFPLWGWWSLTSPRYWDLVCLNSQGGAQCTNMPYVLFFFFVCFFFYSPSHHGLSHANDIFRKALLAGFDGQIMVLLSLSCWASHNSLEQIKMAPLSGCRLFPTHFLSIPNSLFYIYQVYSSKILPMRKRCG